MGVPAGHLGAGTVETENPADSQYGLAERSERSPADRGQEGQAHPGLEGDPRPLHQGGFGHLIQLL